MNRSTLPLLALLIGSTTALAQEAPQPAPPPPPPAPATVPAESAPPPAPRTLDAYGQPIASPTQTAVPAPPDPAYGAIPPEITVRPGTYLTVRVNQQLSSQRNQAGDTFSGTLVQPLAVDGVVVAQRGQTVFGRVAHAQKSKGGKRHQLAVELNTITVADGGQEAIQSQHVVQEGPRAPADRQVSTVANTTLIGAVVGNAISWRSGAAIGAAAGAGAGLATIMATRNGPSVIYPESVLTFQLQAPLTVQTTRAPAAFRFADANDYQAPEPPRLERRDRNRACTACDPLPRLGIGIGIGYGRWGGWGPYWGPGWGWPYRYGRWF